MSYKTILVHLDSEAEAPHLLKAAVTLASQYQSHLIGSVSVELATALRETELDRAAKLEKMFDNATREQNLVAEWRFDLNFLSGVSTQVLKQARSADLIMVSTEPKNTANDTTHIAPIITKCSRPTVVVPESYQDLSLGKFVFVAWDGSGESTRAVFDALPLLQRAENVWLHRVKATFEEKHNGDAETKNLANTLARNDVKVELGESTCKTRKVGQEILSYAKSRGADCIVMGAYGHNRLRGLMLGDTTRYVIEHSNIPLLMSH